nr:GrlR family regulatory protein [Methylobacterium sp. Leaf122]
MKEGLYKIETKIGATSLIGVAVLMGGKVYGGGEQVHFTGNYQLSGDVISLRARLDIHDPTCADPNINFLRDANADVSGTASGSRFELSGSLNRMVGMNSRLSVLLTKLPDYAV